MIRLLKGVLSRVLSLTNEIYDHDASLKWQISRKFRCVNLNVTTSGDLTKLTKSSKYLKKIIYYYDEKKYYKRITIYVLSERTKLTKGLQKHVKFLHNYHNCHNYHKLLE